MQKVSVGVCRDKRRDMECVMVNLTLSTSVMIIETRKSELKTRMVCPCYFAWSGENILDAFSLAWLARM